MKSSSLQKSLIARWQWNNIINFGETRTGTKNTVASQDSIHLLVQNKDSLGIAKFRKHSAWARLGLLAFSQCPSLPPGSASSNQPSQTPSSSGFSTASDNRRCWHEIGKSQKKRIWDPSSSFSLLQVASLADTDSMVPAPTTVLAIISPCPLSLPTFVEIAAACYCWSMGCLISSHTFVTSFLWLVSQLQNCLTWALYAIYQYSKYLRNNHWIKADISGTTKRKKEWENNGSYNT